jgi:hypothetical protein
MSRGLVAVVPFSVDYASGRLFQLGGPLDRDGALVPWVRLAEVLTERGFEVVTHDLLNGREPAAWLVLDVFNPPPPNAIPSQTVILLMEPEVVAPYWYRRFEGAIEGWGAIVMQRRDLAERGPPFHYLRFPQPIMRRPVDGPRDLPLVMINGRKYPAMRKGSLHGARERAAAWFSRRNGIHVFGPGWGDFHPRHPISSWRNLAIRKAARGTVATKASVLDRAEFILCFENMASSGYHTEKLFDAIAGGAIPLYWGDPDVTMVVPKGAFIDYSSLRKPKRARALMASLTREERDRIRAEGQEFLSSPEFARYSPDSFASEIADIIEKVAH